MRAMFNTVTTVLRQCPERAGATLSSIERRNSVTYVAYAQVFISVEEDLSKRARDDAAESRMRRRQCAL